MTGHHFDQQLLLYDHFNILSGITFLNMHYHSWLFWWKITGGMSKGVLVWYQNVFSYGCTKLQNWHVLLVGIHVTSLMFKDFFKNHWSVLDRGWRHHHKHIQAPCLQFLRNTPLCTLTHASSFIQNSIIKLLGNLWVYLLHKQTKCNEMDPMRLRNALTHPLLIDIKTRSVPFQTVAMIVV